MKEFFKNFLVLLSSSLFLIGWFLWSTVRDVTSLHFGAFGLSRLALILVGFGFVLLLLLSFLASRSSRIAMGGCAVGGVVLSGESIFNYPAEYDNPMYSMVFSPEIGDLYVSVAIGVVIFLISLFLPQIKT